MIHHEILRGGVSVDWEVVKRLIAVEDRGGTFLVDQGKVRCLPLGVLTGDDRDYLIAHKPEVMKILSYRGDDHAEHRPSVAANQADHADARFEAGDADPPDASVPSGSTDDPATADDA